MATLSRRVQVLLSSEQYRRLEGLANAEGISVGALVRRAIDRLQGNPRQTKRLRAVRRIAAMSLPVGEWEQMERESLESHDAQA
jgi:Ribbon-helix-helix protein, copG family